MIKKSFRLMLLVAFALSSVMFVACNKYDDDIERIDNELAALNATVSSLKAAVDGGAVISSVSNTTDGVKFTLSNGQSYTVNHGAVGATGATGAAGQDGKPGSVVTIGENGNWFIDGVDQNVSAVGASTFVVDCGSYYELNVVEKVEGENSEIVKINLPKTASIASLKAVSIVNGVIGEAYVELNYGEKLSSKRVFNGTTYAAGTNLIAAGSSLSAVVNPTAVDASLYQFSLVDSKGNAPYVVTEVTANKTEGALTRAATVNNGVWDMAVSFSSDLLFSDQYDLYDYAQARSAAVYALVAKTANGDVASAYDVTVNENKIGLGDFANFAAADLEGEVNEVIDLSETFGDMMPYVVDYYFAFNDNAAAKAAGATLNGNNLVVSKATGTTPVQVKVYYLLVDGTCHDGNNYLSADVIDVTIDHVAENATLSDVEWTITDDEDENYVGVSISGIKSMITPTSDNDIVYVKLTGWTYADGTELDEKTVVVNNVKYGEAGDAAHKFTGNESSWIASINDGKTYRYSYGTAASNFSRSNYVIFNFDHENAFPGEYKATLEFRLNSNSGDAIITAPVKVTIKAPTATPFQRLDAYFNGDDAVAYGTPSTPSGKVTYNLFSLYEEMSTAEMNNVTWSETKHSSSVHSGCATWFTGNENGEIAVAADPDNSGSYNRDGVYTTRTIKAKYVVFGNEHIAYVNDEFSLTIKSEIAEGKLDASAANVEITNAIDAVAVSLKNIKATDVYGRAYNLANIYSKDDDGNYTVNAGSRDSRISSVTFTTEDAQYITVDDTLTNAKDGFSAFTVKRTGNTVLTKDKPCTVYVTVTDNWGRVTKTSFTVTLKK